MLLEHHFNISRITLALNPDLTLTDSECAILDNSVNGLLTNRPVQYVIGEASFCDMDFYVDENVLIPRPETEELVYLIIDDLTKSGNNNANNRILDIGTGSGCIAISLAKSLNNSHVTAIDISESALNVAKRNAIANRVAIDFIQADILSSPHFDSTFDIIVSNPPYVRNSERKDMRPNVLNFEPSAALFVDDSDPCVFYRHITQLAKDHLNLNGTLWLEINECLGEETLQLCKDNGLINSVVIKDFLGKDRFIKASL